MIRMMTITMVMTIVMMRASEKANGFRKTRKDKMVKT